MKFINKMKVVRTLKHGFMKMFNNQSPFNAIKKMMIYDNKAIFLIYEHLTRMV